MPNPPRERGEKQMVDGFPRRNRIDLLTPAKNAIRAAVDAVEHAGAHPLLTEAVILLQEAREKIADFVELTPNTLEARVEKIEEWITSVKDQLV